MFNPDWRKPYRAANKRLQDLQAGTEPWQKKGQSALAAMRERLYGKGTRAFPSMKANLQEGLRSNLRSRGLGWGSTAEDVGNERIQNQVQQETERLTQGEKDYQDALQAEQEATRKQIRQAEDYGVLQGANEELGAAPGLQERVEQLMDTGDQGSYREIITTLSPYLTRPGAEDSVITEWAREMINEAQRRSKQKHDAEVEQARISRETWMREGQENARQGKAEPGPGIELYDTWEKRRRLQ